MPRSTENNSLVFEDVHAGYDGAEKLHGVSARLPGGTLTAIVGPNGSGKSTLVKCAAAQLPLTGGRILLSGAPLSAIDRLERARRVAYMPQSRLVPEIPVRQLVMHGRYPHLKWRRQAGREDREIARAAIDRVGLTALAGRPVSHLSGGERQRAYLAMMLAQQSGVMLLDEPTTYLDPSGQFELMALLRALCGEGICVAAVLHDLNLAMRYADQLLVIRDGRAAAVGAPEKIYDSGILEDAFHIALRRVDGQYIILPQNQNP